MDLKQCVHQHTVQCVERNLMKRTPLKKFKRKIGVEYYPGTTIRKKPNAKPIRKVSKISQNKWNKAREEAFTLWKGLDALTLTPIAGDFVVHHWQKTRSQSPKDKYNIYNLCPMLPEVHNLHSSSDELFYGWQPIIRMNAIRLGIYKSIDLIL